MSAGTGSQSQLANKRSLTKFCCIHRNLHRPLGMVGKNGNRYLRLLGLALNYLDVPATSGTSHNIFSKGGDIVSRRRSSLRPSSVDM
jgi:hAT family C-terminal dimerisation region